MSGEKDFAAQMLQMKFRSLPYTAPKRQQKLKEVTEEGQQAARDASYKLWKRVNPGFFENEDTLTTQRDMQRYEEGDFQIKNKSAFRVRDRHTEFVEFVVRDKALSRKGS